MGKIVVDSIGKAVESNPIATAFDGLYVDKTKPLKSPLCEASKILLEGGFSRKELKVGLMTLVALNSAHLGDPLALEIIADEASGAPNILGLCLEMTPKDYVSEFHEMLPELLYGAGDTLKNKVIVGFDSTKFKKASRELNLLFERGSIVTQDKVRSKYAIGNQEGKIEGPVSLVLITNDPKKIFITNPYALRVHLDHDQDCINNRLLRFLKKVEDCDPGLSKVGNARVKRIFQRLEPRPVRIFDVKQLIGGLLKANSRKATGIAEMIIRINKIIARINNPPAPSASELFARYYQVENEEMSQWLTHNGFIPGQELLPVKGHSSVNEKGYYTFTKFDYYICHSVIDGLFTLMDEPLTSRQVRVFNAIKKINHERYSKKGIQIVDKDTQDDVLKTILHHGEQLYWADEISIKSKVNSDGGEQLGSVYSDLQSLVENKYVDSKKAHNANKKIYAVTTFEIGSRLKLPDPKEIIDPVYKGKTISVVNPITGDIEQI
ncbi:MAG TPA: hypothetical protein VMW89_08280 [Desulfatiglandales bacterium]|nr:hypothetical protein [Desulfatiglandales bacterium]